MNSRISKSGYTLIEVCVGMTVTASVLLLSVQLIHRSFRHASDVRLEQNESRSLHRFSATLRNDVHHATRLIEVTPSRLDLARSESESVVYRIKNQFVLRTARLAGEQQKQVALKLDDEHMGQFDAAQTRGQVTFRAMHHQAARLESPPVVFRVSARLGLRTANVRQVSNEAAETNP